MTNPPGPAPGDDLRFTVPVPPPASGSYHPAPQTDPTQVIPQVQHAPSLPSAPGLGAVGRALFWITVGWWVFFLIRLTSLLAGGGSGSTAAYRTIEMYPAETVVAGVVAVVGAVLLWLARPAASTALRVVALGLSVVTVVVLVWRFVPA